MHRIPVILLCIVNYRVRSGYIYADIVSRRLFGSIHSRVMLIFVKMFVSLFVVIPGVVIMLIVQGITGNELYSAFSIAVWNLFAAMCLFLASKGIFNNIETT